jgi:hypothetical protein
MSVTQQEFTGRQVTGRDMWTRLNWLAAALSFGFVTAVVFGMI